MQMSASDAGVVKRKGRKSLPSYRHFTSHFFSFQSDNVITKHLIELIFSFTAALRLLLPNNKFSLGVLKQRDAKLDPKYANSKMRCLD